MVEVFQKICSPRLFSLFLVMLLFNCGPGDQGSSIQRGEKNYPDPGGNVDYQGEVDEQDDPDDLTNDIDVIDDDPVDDPDPVVVDEDDGYDGGAGDEDPDTDQGGTTLAFSGIFDSPTMSLTMQTLGFGVLTYRGIHLALDIAGEVDDGFGAICAGTISYMSESVGGYGDVNGGSGPVVLLECTDIFFGDKQVEVTVLYGHCSGDGIVSVGDHLERGEDICELEMYVGPGGADWSHLHLGARLGHYPNGKFFIGYAEQSSIEIASWVDVSSWIPTAHSVNPCIGRQTGYYCGDNGLYYYEDSDENLVYCLNGRVADTVYCETCISHPAGQDDECAVPATCTPTSEICNGIDDDCDGAVDEGITRSCSSDCGTGYQTCHGGSWSSCDAPSGSTELCDGIDNDCDGQIDEGVKNACGGCGAVPQESCNGQDDDCDGQIDENLTRSCSSQCGSGSETCSFGNWSSCSAPQGGAEVCNGLDDDCDGQIDEGVKNACGSCGTVPSETCNNQDDDCDGQIDEGVKNACGGCGTVPSETCNNQDDDCDGQVDEGVKNACGGCGTPQYALSCSSYSTRNPYSYEHSHAGGQVLKVEVIDSSSCGSIRLRVRKADGSLMGAGTYSISVGSCVAHAVVRKWHTLNSSASYFDVTVDHRGSTSNPDKQFCARKTDSGAGSLANGWWYSNIVEVTLTQVCQ